MPFISTPANHSYPWYVRLIFWTQKKRYGQTLNPSFLWGRAPVVFAPLALLYAAITRRRSPIDPKLRALVVVRVSQINSCEFCIDVNAAGGIKHGIKDEKMLALKDFSTSPLFNEKEQAVLHYVESITYTDRRPNTENFEQLHQHFNDNGIVELAALIAFQNLSSKFNNALGVEAQGFCSLPKDFTHPES